MIPTVLLGLMALYQLFQRYIGYYVYAFKG